MYKTDIVRTVAKETRLSQRIVDDVLTESLATITQSLRDGQTVVLPGFGTFYTKERKPSQVRHIRTAELIDIPALRQADFRVAAQMVWPQPDRSEQRRAGEQHTRITIEIDQDDYA